MKWNILLFCLLGSLTYNCQAQTGDTTQIRQLLEKESATWRSGDIKGHADCWHLQPYSRILISTADGKFIDLPPAVMINPPPGSAGKGGYSVNSNYKIGINNNSAWVTHDEISVSTDSTKNYTSELRLLEKINGEWKLVGESIHAYKHN